MDDRKVVQALTEALDMAHDIGFQKGAAVSKQAGDLTRRVYEFQENVSKLQAPETAGGLDCASLTDDDLLRLASSRGLRGEDTRQEAVDELVKRHGTSGAAKIIRRFATGRGD